MKRSVRLGGGRQLPRFLFALAIAAVSGMLLLSTATQGFMNPTSFGRPWYRTALPLLGFVRLVIGEILIGRVYRDPEAGERSWRYRDF